MAEETIDPGLLEQTKNQIRKIVAEIDDLAEADIPPAEFHVEFLNRVVAAVAATGGALWLLDQRGTLRLQHQIELRQTGLLDNRQLAAPHEALLGLMMQAAQPQIVPPGAAVEGVPNAGNPTPLAMILAPVIVDKHVVGLVEVLMDPNRRAATQKSTLRFVGDLCDLAARYLKNRQMRQMVSQQKLWNQLENYAHSIHSSLNLRETAYSVVNEAKRLVECDRVSVALKLGHASKVMVEAISGQEVVEQRANLVRELSRLCKAVMASREDLIYTGEVESFPPEIRDALEIYVDESASKLIVITLLYKPESDLKKDREPFGCLVAEQIGDAPAPTDTQARCEVVARHASTALWNAQEHHRIFGLPLLKAIGSPWRFFRGRMLAKILAVLGLILGTILCLAFVPWQLTIEGRGSILPDNRRMTYAPLPGVIIEVPREHGDVVRGPHLDASGKLVPGDLLARIESKDLDSALKKQIAEQSDAVSQIAYLTAQLNNSRTPPDEKLRIKGELAQAEIRLKSAEEQIRIIEDQLRMMEVRSPTDDLVTTWEVRKNFLNRPVDTGQELIQVAAVEGEWLLEVRVPDHDMGPVLAARARLDAAMRPVSEAKAALDSLCASGINAGNAAAIAPALARLSEELDRARQQPIRDLVNVEPAARSIASFSEVLSGLQGGTAPDDAAIRLAKEELDRAIGQVTTLSAYFVSATDPTEKYPGYVRRIASNAEVVEQQNGTKVTVGFSDEVRRAFLKRNQALRPGAEVRARVNCGDAKLAYVLLRDVVSFWHENVSFRWPFLH